MTIKRTGKMAVLLLVMLAFTLVSCKGKSRQVAEGKDIFERMRNTSYEVKLLFPGWTPQADKDLVIKALNDKLAELGYPGLKIRLDGLDWGSWNERGNAIVLSGGDYDIVNAPSWWNFYGDAMAGGAWAPWEKYIDEFPEYTKLIARWKDAMYEWSGLDLESKHIYRAPNIKEYANVPCEVRWNKTVADKLGITEGLRNVKTVYELEPFLELYKNAYTNNGMAVLAVETDSLANCFQLGANIFYPVYNPNTNKYETGAFSPWFDEYIALRRDWRAKGYIPDYEQTESYDDLILKFGPESFLVFFQGGKPGGEAELNTAAMQVYGFEWGTTFLTPPLIDINSLMGNCFAINRRSGNIEASAFMHMLLNTNRELTNLINFGIEGVHYTMDDTATLIKNEPSRYFPNLMWMLGNRTLCHRLPGEPENLGQIYTDFNERAIAFPNLTFPLPSTEAWTGVDLDLHAGVVAALLTQYTRSIHVGTISDADITDIRNRLNQANRRTIEDIYNREYKAWIETQ